MEFFDRFCADLDVVSVHRKPDCFRRAAAHIRTRCDTLEVDEPARVRAAISMTLCELKTAQHRSLPMECSPFDSGTDQNSAAGDDHSFCVEALSRSTQFWASYSGYLREIRTS
ncbi:hypothetical protein OF83DRAFT_1051319 [Amylostereum chailletii]|nr:hypothetical protein OF83DRAFT_1051319 [Amylostereum chailletii]